MKKIITFLLISLFLSLTVLHTGYATSPLEVPRPILWVATSDGLTGNNLISTDELINIPIAKGAKAITVDSASGRVWVQSEGELQGYDIAGNVFTTKDISALSGINFYPEKVSELIINPVDGKIWLAAGDILYRFSNEGNYLGYSVLPGPISALTTESAKTTIWVAIGESIHLVSEEGGSISELSLNTSSAIIDISFDDTLGEIWVALSDTLKRYSVDSTEQYTKQFDGIDKLDVANGSGLWVAAGKNAYYFDFQNLTWSDAVVLAGNGNANVLDLAIGTNGSAWVANHKLAINISTSGQILQEYSMAGNTKLFALDVYQDTVLPTIQITSPLEGDVIEFTTTDIGLTYNDVGFGIDPTSLEFYLDGIQFSAYCIAAPQGHTCSSEDNYIDGPHELSVIVSDFAGNKSLPAVVNFTVVPIDFISVTSDSLTNQAGYLLAGKLYAPGSLTVNGSPATVDSNNDFTANVALLEGPNTLSLVATSGTSSYSLEFTVELDTTAPVVDSELIRVGVEGAGHVSVVGEVGSVEADASIEIMNINTGASIIIMANSDGSFSTSLVGTEGDVIHFRVLDQLGNTDGPFNKTVVDIIAPTLSATTATTVFAATEFIYAGNYPVQLGVAEGTIKEEQVTAIQGVVKDINGQPMAGVQVSIFNHPEYGYTSTRYNGKFYLVVNGGDHLTLDYEKTGYFHVQRLIETNWQRFAMARDVVMLQPDPVGSIIDLTSTAPMQLAIGSDVTDSDGTRHATVMIPNGTTAEMELENGTRQALSNFTLRITEYSVGDDRESMLPATLPDNVTNTSVMELSVDEAMAINATTVHFSQPVSIYVNNFLELPVGWAVPNAYYDRQLAQWVGTDNGIIIKILSITDGIADIDTDGSGIAANITTLSDLGITDVERQQLAILYNPGDSLWRTVVNHFTPISPCWPFGVPEGAEGPQLEQPPEEEPESCEKDGSIIECQNQILGETVNLTGLPFSLNYRNNRTVGRKANYKINIPLTEGSPDPKITRIYAEVKIAGRIETFDFAPQADQSFAYEWDGKDDFGRIIYGAQPLTVDIGYAYKAAYMPARTERLQSYREAASTVDYFSMNKKLEVILWQKFNFNVTHFHPDSAGVGAWTVDIHHQYDPMIQMLYLGSGSRRSALDRNRIINTVAGTGGYGSTGDSGLATNAQLQFPIAIDVAQNGDLYVADRDANVIRKVDNYGVITTVAGTGVGGFSGDGGLAVDAQLDGPQGVAVHPDGTIYISDGNNNRIRKVDPNGMITTYAGTGEWDFGGDGGPAINAHMNWPQNIKLDKDGSLFVADYWNFRIRRIDPVGIITTVAGSDEWADDGGDGGLATAYSLDFAQAATPDSQGNLLIVDTLRTLVRKVSTDGIIQSMVGQLYSSGASDNGELAFNAKISDPYDVEIDQEGNIYIVTLLDNCIKKVTPNGIMSTFAGKCDWSRYGFDGDGGYARNALMNAPWSISVAPDGSLYIADPYNRVIRRVHQAFPRFDSEDLAIASENGEQLYQFDKTGRHLKTWNTTTGQVIYDFGYDANGYLTQIQDQDGKITSIHRNSIGEPVSIAAPHGQITSLTLDPNGYLASVANPLDQQHQFAYTADGLLTDYINPRFNVSVLSYDTDGYLQSDLNAQNGGWTLQRSNSNLGHVVDMTTGEGRKLQYQVDHLDSGDKRWINTNKDGTKVTTLFKTDGETITTLPNGNIVRVQKGADPRFSVERPTRKKTIQTPAGLIFSASETRTATLTNPDDWFSHTKLTESNDVNGRISTSVFDVVSQTWTFTSPEGRQALLQVDAANRPISYSVPGIEPVTYTYNNLGYLTSTTQGIRSSQYNYHQSGYQSGYLSTVTDTLGRESAFSYFASGEVATTSLPGNRDVTYQYDASQNTTGVTPPDKSQHAYSYSVVDLVSSYAPPAIAGIENVATQYEYNLDKQLELTTLPDAKVIDYVYAPDSGKLTSLSIPVGLYIFSYNQVTGLLEQITAPDNGTLSYQYDGDLLLSTAWDGVIAGNVSQVYNNDFSVTERQVNGTNPVSFVFDNDLLLTSAGDLNINRDPLNGLITGTELGSMLTSRTYNSFGEPDKVSALFGANLLFDTSYSFDDIGRITQKVELMEGVTQTSDYSYDAAGRLSEVKTNGTSTEDYSYDANGNRLTATVGGVSVSGSYDAQDRLNQYGNLTYVYTDNGHVASVTDSVTSETTLYSYDVLSNLVAAILPDLTTIEYVIDGQNRRIGKKVNGTLVQGFLYKDQLNPVAELDGQGNIVSRFVYGSKPFVPDYMVKAGKTYRIISDHLGSVRLVLDTATGLVTQRIDYDSFGNILNDTNPAFQPFGFAGGLYDEHLGITRFGARDYDPQAGRWLTKDPIGLRGGLNTYNYVDGNPLTDIDPKGLINEGSTTYGQPQWVQNSIRNRRECTATAGNKAFIDHNTDIPGLIAPPGLAFFSAGGVARVLSVESMASAIFNSAVYSAANATRMPPTNWSGAFRAAGINALIVSGAFETGLFIGSHLYAEFTADCECDGE